MYYCIGKLSKVRESPSGELSIRVNINWDTYIGNFPTSIMRSNDILKKFLTSLIHRTDISINLLSMEEACAYDNIAQFQYDSTSYFYRIKINFHTKDISIAFLNKNINDFLDKTPNISPQDTLRKFISNRAYSSNEKYIPNSNKKLHVSWTNKPQYEE